MNRYRLTLVAAVCSALSLYFMDCEVEQQRTEIAERNALTLSAAQEEFAAMDVETEAREENQPVAQETVSKELKLAFEPPFPERTNIFQAPKRQGAGRASTEGQSETSVELLGFVNVDGQHVALSIDGLVMMVAEGEKQNGIEVISIQPPAVVLQRGRQRWQASFEN